MYDLPLWARSEIKKIDGLYLMDDEYWGEPGCFAQDPTKIVVNVRGLGLSGYEVEKILRKVYHIQVELSDLSNVLALVSFADDRQSLSKLINALHKIADGRNIKNVIKYSLPIPKLPEVVVSPREAFYGETRPIIFDEAEGEISAELIMAYPPGIPIICPGERITRDIIDYVNILRKEKAEIQGTEDHEVKVIKVLQQRVHVEQQTNYPLSLA